MRAHGLAAPCPAAARRLALAMALAGLVACAQAPAAVDLSGAWPEQTRSFRQVTVDWTRSARLRTPLSTETAQVLEVYATFKSPEWRSAYVAFSRDRRLLPAPEVAALAEAQRADLEGHYEVHLLVATHDRRINDLHKGARSSWRLALVDDAGVEIEPVQVRRDRRPRTEIEAEFPHLTAWHLVYIARFPRTVELLRGDARHFSLKMSSQQGGVELVWRAR
jgi:hypothetical protein